MKDWETGARDALVKSGAIVPCRDHFDIYLRTHDKDAERRAYAIATSMLNSYEVRDGPRTEFISLIADMLDRTPDSCFIGEAAYEKDDDAA